MRTGERYLSREYHEGLIGPSNPPLRTEYVRFTADATTGLGSHLNQRFEKARTVYPTDGDSPIDVTFSNFDGLGSFRTRNRSGLGGPTGRTETVSFNPGSGSHDCTSTTVGITCTGTFTPPSTSSAWILDDYDQATQAEDGDAAKR